MPEMTVNTNTSDQALKAIFKKFNSEFKYDIAHTEVKVVKRDRIPFSSARLNHLAYGGIPKGGISEFFGEEGSGKSTTALDIVSNAQKMWPDKSVIFVDVETTYDPIWATTLGVDSSRLFYINPEGETAEAILQMIITILENKDTDISLIVLDSIGAMISKQAYEKTIEESTMAGIAKPLTTFLGKATPLLRQKNAAMIVINQVRDDMNSSYGGVTTPGGRGLKHHALLRLRFRRSDYIDELGTTLSTQAENPAGHYVKVNLVKTKVSRPDRKVAFYALNYRKGVDKSLDLIDVGIKIEVIRKGGNWYYIEDDAGEELRFQGKVKFKAELDANPVLYEMLEGRINDILTAEDDIVKAQKVQAVVEEDAKDLKDLDEVIL